MLSPCIIYEISVLSKDLDNKTQNFKFDVYF